MNRLGSHQVAPKRPSLIALSSSSREPSPDHQTVRAVCPLSKTAGWIYNHVSPCSVGQRPDSWLLWGSVGLALCSKATYDGGPLMIEKVSHSCRVTLGAGEGMEMSRWDQATVALLRPSQGATDDGPFVVLVLWTSFCLDFRFFFIQVFYIT